MDQSTTHSSTDTLNLQQLNQQISTRIYQRFAQGRVITKLDFHTIKSTLVEDKDYTYLFRFFREFELLYALMGKKLVHHVKGEFYYIDNVSDSDVDEADEHALKTQSILLVLARHFEISGRGLHRLSDIHTGVDLKQLSEIEANDEYRAICKALKLQNWSKAMDYLVNRGFAYQTSPETYCLSSAGGAFCDAVIEAYEQR